MGSRARRVSQPRRRPLSRGTGGVVIVSPTAVDNAVHNTGCGPQRGVPQSGRGWVRAIHFWLRPRTAAISADVTRLRCSDAINDPTSSGAARNRSSRSSPVRRRHRALAGLGSAKAVWRFSSSVRRVARQWSHSFPGTVRIVPQRPHGCGRRRGRPADTTAKDSSSRIPCRTAAHTHDTRPPRRCGPPSPTRPGHSGPRPSDRQRWAVRDPGGPSSRGRCTADQPFPSHIRTPHTATCP